MTSPGALAVRTAPILLSFGTGALDGVCFFGLGQVFASVMTGNLVILGLAAGTWDPSLALAAGTALLAFAAGAILGAAFVSRPHGWKSLAAAFVLELAALASFLVLWMRAGAHRDVSEQLTLLVIAAVAMGVQSAAVASLGLPDLSTTFMTGTLTRLLFSVGARRPGESFDWWAAARLLALVAGAAVAAVLLQSGETLAPVVPLGAVVLAAPATVIGGR